MKFLRNASMVAALAAASLIAAAGAFAAGVDDALLGDANRLFAALPAPSPPASPDQVRLGRLLFYETRVSVDGTVSCARCHLPSLYGTDGLAKGHGHHDKLNPRNVPTVFNAALQFAQHWRGDRRDVEDQASQALTGAVSYGNPDAAAATARLKALPDGYADLFRKAFPGEADPVTIANFGKAIGAFERTLTTPSRFDEFLKGRADALTAREKAGLREFIDFGCAGCHDGAGVGGGSFQKFGVVADYWTATGVAEPDKGRFDVTKQSEDLYVFKTPSLLNVAVTPPFFHDGSIQKLDDAVRIMAQVQLGVALSDAEVGDIVAFLDSLTGPVPPSFTPPTAPAGAFVP